MPGLGQNAPMADQATETMEIAAPADRILDVLLDFDAYPTWAKDLKGVTVESTRRRGAGAARSRSGPPPWAAARATRCATTTGPPHLGWELVRGDIMRKLDGSYELAPGGTDGRTLVTYHLAVDLDHPAAGLREAARRAEDHPHRAARAAGARGSPVTRVLLFTGKGGVGKTTTAAATAVRCADAGLRTIVLSTDPAHSLADAFDVPLGPLPAPIADNLWGQQLDAQERMEEGWHEIQGYLREVFNWAGVDGLEAEELSVIPGLDEIFSLTDIKGFAESGEWDVVVVDCAPTAETIRFLSLPDILARYMERLFPVGRRVNKVIAPVLSRVTSLPVADDGVFENVSAFYDRLDGVREILIDPARSSVRLVVNPERMVIAEARRTYTYLSLFGYRVDAVIANRLLPGRGVRPVVRPVEGAPRRAPQDDRGQLRPAARAHRGAGRRGAGGRGLAPRLRRARSTASATPPASCTRASR